MGYPSAYGMAAAVDLDTALTWHLQSNHYPPVPVAMLQTCKDAIAACVEKDYQRAIAMPEGVLYHGRATITAHEAVESLHLHAFLDVAREAESHEL